jgi:hypothetical protein
MLEVLFFSLLKAEFREGNTAQGYIATELELELIWHIVCQPYRLELGTKNSNHTELFLEMSELKILCFIHFYLEIFTPVSCVQNATPIFLATSPQPHLLGAVLG